MSDLVDWLIAEADTCRSEDLPVSEGRLRAAAAEIKRLRAALRETVEAYERSQDFILPDAYIIERAKEALGEDE